MQAQEALGNRLPSLVGLGTGDVVTLLSGPMVNRQMVHRQLCGKGSTQEDQLHLDSGNRSVALCRVSRASQMRAGMGAQGSQKPGQKGLA